MIRCTGTKGAICCSSEQSFYHSGCSTRCILPSHFHLRWDAAWSMCRCTCRFPESRTLRRRENAGLRFFLLVAMPPSSICFSWLASSVCATLSCRSHPAFQARGGKRVLEHTEGVCRFLETSCRELPGFEYFQNSGPLVGDKHWNVWPGIPLKVWPRFCCLGGESERCVCGSQLGGQRPHQGGEAKGQGRWGMMASSPAGTSSQPSWDVLPKPRSSGFWSRDRCLTIQAKRILLQTSEEGHEKILDRKTTDFWGLHTLCAWMIHMDMSTQQICSTLYHLSRNTIPRTWVCCSMI